MTIWTDLREILSDLQADPAAPLQSYPNPDGDEPDPPYRIRLQAWATDFAAELHRRFGAEVDLVVGSLHYPDRQRVGRGEPEPPALPECPLLPAGLTVSLDTPLVVASGYNTRSTIRIHNHQAHDEVVATNGQLTGRVLDPRTHDVVGGFSGFQPMPLVTFKIPPFQSQVIPLLIGTAATVGDLGYAVPAGQWAFDTIVTTEEGQYRTPPLPLRVTHQPSRGGS